MVDERHFHPGDEQDLEITLTSKEPAAETADNQAVSEKVIVRIAKIAKDYIREYVSTDTSRELGGVLVGNYRTIGDQVIVYITAAIKASYTDAAKSEIKFTHQTWEDIDRVKEEYYPHEKIVGWFHSHPGFGVFLSDYDLFIQNNFFKLPFQVAYVIDPVRGKSSFYGNVEGNIVKIKSEVPAPAAAGTRSAVSVKGYARKNRVKPIMAGILVLLLLAGGYFAYRYFFMPPEQVNPLNQPGMTAGEEEQADAGSSEESAYFLEARIEQLEQDNRVWINQVEELQQKNRDLERRNRELEEAIAVFEVDQEIPLENNAELEPEGRLPLSEDSDQQPGSNQGI